MAKGKKSKKDDVELESDSGNSESEVVERKKGGKKEKRKKKDSYVSGDVEDEMEKLDLNAEDSDGEEGEKKKAEKPKGSATSTNKREKKKGKKGKAEDSGEEEEAVVVQKGAFALLMDDDDSLPSDQSDKEEEEEEKPKTPPPAKEKKNKKKKGGKTDEGPAEDLEEAEEGGGKGKKKKKKKGKKGEDDEEDLDAMLAALRAEYDGEAPPPDAADAFKDKEEEGGGKKKKKKGKKDDTAADTAAAAEAGFEVIDGAEAAVPPESGAKTAAQKKKEKKQKQKEAAGSGGAEGDQGTGTEKAAVQKQESVEEKKEEGEEGGDGEEEEGGKKGKKKKGGKKEEEEKKKKKPNKAVLAAMQEALAKQKEEDERLLRLEEEKEKAEEERIRLAVEKKKADEEKRLAKKEREKQKKAELKAQGKLLTPAQKLAKQRAEAMLEAMRAQGVDVPAVGEKRPRPGTRMRLNKGKGKQAERKEEEEKKEEEGEEEEEEEDTEQQQQKEEEEAAPAADAPLADSWEEVEEIKDSWEVDSDTEEEKKKKAAKAKEEAKAKETASAAAKKKAAEEVEEEDEEEEDESEEESDEDDEDDSEEESEDDSDEESEEENLAEAEKKRKRAMERIQKRKEDNERGRSVSVLRAPVVCVLGHVDTGKTKILDKLRRTNVQDGEAGGITQQIGATNVPIGVVREQCKMVPEFQASEVILPGLLIIDTPGHESFSNLRDRGSSLCDIAILVVDIMHALEPQTIESLNLLKKKKTPFVVALNKIDRLYEWKPNKHKDVREVLENQQHNTKMEFEKRKNEVILGLNEQGMNAALFWENPDPTDYISLIPTSAHSGDGMGNLMASLVELSQTQLAKRLSFTEELQATVLEVKAIGGFGTTIDLVLVNGRMKFGQTLVLAGTDGPIVTTIKALLTPAKMQDLRVKNQYIEHKELQAAQGVKIAAKELEKTIAGLTVRVAYHQDEVEILKAEAEADLRSALNAIKLKDRGVFVQASTLGSLEALLEFLKTSKIPYAGVRIGPVVRKDVMRASTMLEHEEKYAVILAFDVKVERDAQEMADREGVRIFQADIIYHLFDRFTEYQNELIRQKKEQFRSIAVFPCKLKVMKEHVYMSRDPIVVGVRVEAGIVKTGTPICVPSKEFIYIGICTGIQHNSKDVDTARKGDEVCVKIEAVPGEAPKMFGRHFDETDLLISRISRESIDACKDYFRDELQKTDWILMVELKKLFEIL